MGEDKLRIELSPDGDQPVLVLTHTFDDEPGATSFGAGLDQCLAALAPHLAGEPAPEPGRGVKRHEELVARFGLAQPTVTEDDGRWTVRFERQLTCPVEVAGNRSSGRTSSQVSSGLRRASGNR